MSEKDEKKDDIPEEFYSWEELLNTLREKMSVNFDEEKPQGFIPTKIIIERIPYKKDIIKITIQDIFKDHELELTPISALVIGFSHLAGIVHGTINDELMVSPAKFIEYIQDSLTLLLLQYFRDKNQLLDVLNSEKAQRLQNALNMALWEIAEVINQKLEENEEE